MLQKYFQDIKQTKSAEFYEEKSNICFKKELKSYILHQLVYAKNSGKANRKLTIAVFLGRRQ